MTKLAYKKYKRCIKCLNIYGSDYKHDDNYCPICQFALMKKEVKFTSWKENPYSLEDLKGGLKTNKQ